MPRLTAKFIENVKPRDQRIEIPDGGCRGLFLIVQPVTGKRSWAIRYRYGGRTRKLTLDGFPSLAEARRRATTALHELDQGRDPALIKFEARTLAAQADAERKRNTIEQLAMQYLDQRVRKRLRPNSLRQVEHIFDDLILPAWHGRNVVDVRRRDVIELVEAIATDRPIMANRTLSALSRFFGWLCRCDVIAASPCAGVEQPSKESPRERTLDSDEIGALWRACDAIGEPAGSCVKLMMILGQRRSEIAGMRRSEITGDLWTIPAERMKGGVAHTLPLPARALAIIEQMPVIGDVVFTLGAAPLANFDRIKRTLDAHMPAKAPWVFHDLRRSCASGLAALGVPVATVEKILAHRSGTFRGIVGTYQRHSFIPEMRAALERWSEHVEQLAYGTTTAKGYLA